MPTLINRFSTDTGLHIVPRDFKAASRDVLVSILAVTFFVIGLDVYLFRSHLTPGYLAFFTSPLLPRILGIAILAALEEIKFRLLLMSGLVWFLSLLRGKLTMPAVIAAIVVAQLANVGHLVLIDPLYAGLRYWLVGCVWGWLYWRHGWLAALAGHVLTHPLLDPLLLLVLSN